MAPQSASHRRLRQRIKRTLNFGTKAPRSIHYPLTEMMVEYFNQVSPFDYLKYETSAAVSSCGFADTCTLVVAMCYLDRLRMRKKVLFEQSDPKDLYVPALVLASKFLHDSDQDERVADEDWAEATAMDRASLSRLEWQFVKAIDWDLSVKDDQFEKQLQEIETWVAANFVSKNAFCTYNELRLLSDAMSCSLYESLRAFCSLVSLCALFYSATVASMLVVPLAFSPLHREPSLPQRHHQLLQVSPNCPSRLPHTSLPCPVVLSRPSSPSALSFPRYLASIGNLTGLAQPADKLVRMYLYSSGGVVFT